MLEHFPPDCPRIDSAMRSDNRDKVGEKVLHDDARSWRTRHRDANCTLIAIMTIWFRTKRAIPIHPVAHMAIIMVLKPGRRIYAKRVSTIVVGMLLRTL